MVSKSASGGMARVARSPHVPIVTSAPTVEVRIQHRNATSSGFSPIVTPFIWDKWEELL